MSGYICGAQAGTEGKFYCANGKFIFTLKPFFIFHSVDINTEGLYEVWIFHLGIVISIITIKFYTFVNG